ncbi:MAG TPA: glycerophosphodiester phosphodiesterase family protein [Marmoricola sp.]|nr:glycerophosphodiester phosphodiesterase family protein [Marmoricola sp.]HNO39970.1 glycerophosphodiester phosphodiesterase family protein [Marmoricola sp.]
MTSVRPQVVAHRGSSATNAEHTLKAYLAALEEGAEGLECDVRLSADGHLICFHDRDLRRTAGKRATISTMDLADLEAIDVSTWKNPWADLDDEAEEVDPEQRNVLTMRELLTTVADYPRRVELAIETKHPTRYGGLVEKRLAQLLREFGWHLAGSPVRVMSFSWVALRRFRRWCPDLDVVFLMDSTTQWPRATTLLDDNVIAGPGIELLRTHPGFIKRVGKRSRLHCWTVNTESDIDLCLELGVSALITDKPRDTLEYLDKLGL